MKILSLSNCPLDPALGSGRTRLAWAAGLRALGHEVTGVESVELLGGSEGAPANRRLRLARGAWRFLRENDPDRYDLIEFFGAEFWLPTWRLSARRKRPVLVAHTDGLELLAEERLKTLQTPESIPRGWIAQGVRPFLSGLKKRLERLAFTRADGFVTASDADREYLLRHGLRSVATTEVVLLGLEPAYHDLPPGPPHAREERVAFLGTWLERKGIRCVVPVMTALLRERPGLRLDLDGVGMPAGVPLNDFPEDVRARITVRERVTTPESIAALTRAKVFFLPSEYEGFGLATAEAMACGCAVVTTPTGFGANLRDGVDALVCPFGDTAAMTAGIRRLLDDGALRDRVAAAGYARAQALRWDDSVRRLETIYLRWVADAARDRAHR